MVIYPPESLPVVFTPICFVRGFSMAVKNKVPSIIWEVGLFLPELTSEGLGDRATASHTCCSSSHKVGQEVTGAHCFACLICTQTRTQVSESRDLMLTDLPSRVEAPVVPSSRRTPRLPSLLDGSSGSPTSGTY